jgi:nitroimidazol reductase NimA-like FMN-containing flavoprotein (pyridoxamine 5'-phosphate oxidase superfamily)
MPQLTKPEIDQLLATAIIARLATVKPDGSPYIAPVWESWDGESMYIIPRGKSKFVEYIKANPRVAISCADDINPDHSRVLLEGTIEIVEGPVRMEGLGLEIGTEMVQRYSGEAGLAYLEKTRDNLRYLLKLTPDKITSWRGEWHRRYAEDK